MAYFSGNSGDAKVGGTALKITSWKATEEVEILETTNKSSAGKKEKIYGNSQVSGSVEANWDGTLNPGNPPLIYAGKSADGQVGVALVLEITSGGNTFSIPYALISKCEISNPVDGLVSYSFDFESSGSYTRPGEGS